MRDRKRKPAAKRTIATAVVLIVVLTVLIVLAFSQVFVVRDIMVVGNRNLLREEIITLSGVRTGDRWFSITNERLRERLESNRYIEYVGREFDYRGTLTIRINERLGLAVVFEGGLYYVLDAAGMALECTGGEYPVSVAGPRVTGLEIDTNSRVIVGEKMPVRDAKVLETMQNVLRELEEIGLLSQISQLSLANLENIYAMTADGAKIELGDADNMLVKLAIAREVIAQRKDMGDLQGAKIDVSNAKNAHYIPAVLPTPTPVPTATPKPEPEPTPEA